MIWVLQIWFIIYLWSKPHSLFTYLSSPQWHYQERRMETDTETNLYSTASLLIHFLKFCFILYTISDKVVYLLCVYSISCQIQLNFDDGHNLHQRRILSVHVFCRIRTIVGKFWGKWLNRFLHKYEYGIRLWIDLHWLVGSHRPEAGVKTEDGRCDQWLRGEDGNCGIKTSPLK